MTTSKRGPRLISVQLSKSDVKVYAGAKVADALKELMSEMTLYAGVKFAQVAEAIYEQGRRDGRRDVIQELDRSVDTLKRDPALRHRNPGRPRRITKKK